MHMKYTLCKSCGTYVQVSSKLWIWIWNEIHWGGTKGLLPAYTMYTFIPQTWPMYNNSFHASVIAAWWASIKKCSIKKKKKNQTEKETMTAEIQNAIHMILWIESYILWIKAT